MNGIKCPTAFFMTRADLITCWLEKAPFQYRNTLFQTNEKAFSQLLGVHFISRYFYEYSTIILRFYVIFTNILQLFYEGALDMKWQLTNETRSAELVIIILNPASPSRIIVFGYFLTQLACPFFSTCNNLRPTHTLICDDFPRPTIKFHGFPGFPWSVRTLSYFVCFTSFIDIIIVIVIIIFCFIFWLLLFTSVARAMKVLRKLGWCCLQIGVGIVRVD